MQNYILSVLVNNHFGVLTRISGLFARRGYNIKSLTVGETQDENISRMTIEFFGDESHRPHTRHAAPDSRHIPRQNGGRRVRQPYL